MQQTLKSINRLDLLGCHLHLVCCVTGFKVFSIRLNVVKENRITMNSLEKKGRKDTPQYFSGQMIA